MAGSARLDLFQEHEHDRDEHAQHQGTRADGDE
jgi:hypothetical protein